MGISTKGHANKKAGVKKGHAPTTSMKKDGFDTRNSYANVVKTKIKNF